MDPDSDALQELIEQAKDETMSPFEADVSS